MRKCWSNRAHRIFILPTAPARTAFASVPHAERRLTTRSSDVSSRSRHDFHHHVASRYRSAHRVDFGATSGSQTSMSNETWMPAVPLPAVDASTIDDPGDDILHREHVHTERETLSRRRDSDADEHRGGSTGAKVPIFDSSAGSGPRSWRAVSRARCLTASRRRSCRRVYSPRAAGSALLRRGPHRRPPRPIPCLTATLPRTNGIAPCRTIQRGLVELHAPRDIAMDFGARRAVPVSGPAWAGPLWLTEYPSVASCR